MRNIPEVQALVTLSPHLDQQILASEAHDIKGTPSSVWEPWSPEPVLLISSHWSRKDGLKVELGAGLWKGSWWGFLRPKRKWKVHILTWSIGLVC